MNSEYLLSGIFSLVIGLIMFFTQDRYYKLLLIPKTLFITTGILISIIALLSNDNKKWIWEKNNEVEND